MEEVKRPKATITQISNRQVNYAIIRLLWNEYRKDENLYDFIGIPKNGYANIINAEYTMLMDSESKKLESIWGVDASVFNGNTVVEVEGIERETWDEYFNNRDDNKTEEVKAFTKKFHTVTQIEQFMGKSKTELHLWKLYRFIRFKETYTGTIQEIKMDNAVDTLEDVSSVLFESINLDKLNSYIKILETAITKAKITRDYREMKAKESY